MQVLRQDGVFDRPEQRRVQAEQEQRGQQHRQAVQRRNPAPATTMMPISSTLTRRARRALSYLSASWPAVAENRKKGRMKMPAARLASSSGLERGPAGGLKGQQHHQGVLEHVVVERAEKLGDEERRETPFSRRRNCELMSGSEGRNRRVWKMPSARRWPCQRKVPFEDEVEQQRVVCRGGRSAPARRLGIEQAGGDQLAWREQRHHAGQRIVGAVEQAAVPGFAFDDGLDDPTRGCAG